MATLSTIAPHFTRVAVHPRSAAGAHYRAGRESAARLRGFPAERGLNLRFLGGRTIERLTFTHVYLGGEAAWSTDDIARIDAALPAAMTDRHLENVIAQYYPDGRPTSTFRPSRMLDAPLRHTVYRDTVEEIAAALERTNGLSGLPLASTVFCFLLPRGVVLVDGESTARQWGGDADDAAEEPVHNPALRERDEAVDSRHGLGGYHGSIHPRRGSRSETLYYAVGVYSDGGNGIPAFDEPWKSVCATFYHELCEARTDPDVEDAIRAGDTPQAERYLGWYSPKGGEIGDIPMEEAGSDLGAVMREVRLADGTGTVPIQLMWSNAVAGPEGPTARKHQASAQ
jgi:hypothetical protein